ncbi:hypothetical protein LE134_02070 [Escherichia coli]|uniref:hypothetical protein n=1 Tax=Escherichia coli TaxID=562 RepID=UPI00375530A4|nr:hypothetical protein [Escherichia coli]
MNYEYDLADFKRYLYDKNHSYRVDGLIFWQNRIPLPIDLFNRIFDESDLIIADFVYQVAASAVVFSEKESFESTFGLEVTNLPTDKLKAEIPALSTWVDEHLPENCRIVRMIYEIAELLGLPEFRFSGDRIAKSLAHQGKKYARLFMPSPVKDLVNNIQGCDTIGQDNTDMFGNIIADRYNIYRSGFSDALAIIFNALLEFRLLFSGKSGNLPRFRVMMTAPDDIDIRFGKTADGSLWEPGYEDDHFITINTEHPVMKNQAKDQGCALAELLFFIGQYENSQFSDQNKKFIENMRQTISRNLWIKYD